MIISFRHKGLRILWESGDSRYIHEEWGFKIRRILNALDLAERLEDLDFPGWYLHPLKGRYSGYYSLRVSKNWRIIFRFENGNASGIDLIDYH